MKSKMSCFNAAVLKRTLFRGLPLWGAYLLCWLVAMPVVILSNGNYQEMVYLKDYFKTVYNRDMEDFGQPVESMLRSLGIIAANGEVTRAGMMYFGKNPGLHERSFMVKAVAFDGVTIGDTSYIDSRDISGTIPWMFRESMTFLKSVLRHQQQGENFNKVGILEIPEVVLEELLQNAFVHIDLLHAAAIRTAAKNA
jgi:predicted HTH transcriptional regulator